MRKQSLTLLALGLSSLTISAQDLPEGPGKETFTRVCTQCHGLDIIITQKRTKAEWKELVNIMVSYGATAKDEEFEAIIDYLAKNFGKSDAAANLK